MTSPAPVGRLAFSLKDSGPAFLFLGFGDTCAHTKSVDSIHSAIHVVISNRNILGLLGKMLKNLESECQKFSPAALCSGQLLGKIIKIWCRIPKICFGQLLGNFGHLGNLLWATIREFLLSQFGPGQLLRGEL